MIKQFSTFILSMVLTLDYASAAQKSAGYRAPDARQVKVGHYQEIFEPSTFNTTSYTFLSENKSRGNFQANLPPCAEVEGSCIQSLEFSKDQNTWTKATPGKDEGQRSYSSGALLSSGAWKWNTTSVYREDLTQYLPNGATVRGWDALDHPHAGGTSYNVVATLSGFFDSGLKKYVINEFDFRVIPVSRGIVSNRQECGDSGEFQEIGPEGMKNPGLCFTPYDFPENLKIRLTLNLGSFVKSLNGWFDGRLFQPEVNIDSKNGVLQISGYPLKVPVISTEQIPYESVPKMISPEISFQKEQTKSGIGMLNSTVGNQSLALNRWSKLENYMMEKNLGLQTIWSLTSFSGNNKCVARNSVSGIVSTNATVYQSSAPEWRAKDKSLNFKVATSHLNYDGDEFKGYYSLLLTAKTATCLWGKGLTKAVAKISVQGRDGQSSVATTSYGIKNNWANFTAAGFTFSSPIISVTFQKK